MTATNNVVFKTLFSNEKKKPPTNSGVTNCVDRLKYYLLSGYHSLICAVGISKCW